MNGYEYKVIPAPSKGRKARGIKGAEARFAHALELQMNELATEGWEYLRADILPSEERQGLTSTQTVYRSVLVFRRFVEDAEEMDAFMEETEENPDEQAIEDASTDVEPTASDEQTESISETDGDDAPEDKS